MQNAIYLRTSCSRLYMIAIPLKIKYRKEFRSRRAKFVYYYYKCVECACHVSRHRDREPRCIPCSEKAKRLSQKSRTEVKVVCVEKNAKANFYRYVKCRLLRSRKMKRRK